MKSWPAKPETTPETIQLIAEMMTDGRYMRGDTKSLAAAWGRPFGTVVNWTQEASVRVRAAVSDDGLKARVETRLDEILDDDNPKDRVLAAKLLLDTRGLLTTKHEVSHVTSAAEEKLILEAVKRSLGSPRVRELILAEIRKFDAALLTEGSASGDTETA